MSQSVVPPTTGFVNHGSATIQTYNDVAGNQINKFVNTRGTQELLRLSAATGAAWNSASRCPAEVCCEGTRERVLSGILQWLDDFRNRGKVYWLTGASGLGKSAIAQSLALRCTDRDILGASFFFSQDDANRNNARKLFTTIAYQLSLISKKQNQRTRQVLEADPGAPDRAPSDQLQRLLVETLPKTFQKAVVVIDGIEQGGSDDLLQDILPVILKAAQTTPLRFVITSQMTSTIQGFMQNNTKHIKATDLLSYDADLDIRQFFLIQFNQLSTSRAVNNWYTEQDIKQLVTASGGLFVYAAAVAKYIASGKRRSPRQRLEDVLRIGIKEFPEIRDRLDALYRRILSQIPQRDYDDLTRQVIGTVCLVSYPLCLPDLDTLLGLDIGDTWQCLQDLHAFFLVPNGEDKESCVRVAHGYFREFICDPQRSNQYAINSETHQTYLGTRCLSTINSTLRRNVCELPLSGTLSDAQTDALVRGKRDACVSGASQYASRFWYHHLQGRATSAESTNELQSFVKHSILHWVETMGLFCHMDEAVYVLREAKPLIQKLQDAALAQRFEDVERATKSKQAELLDWPLNVYDLGVSDFFDDGHSSTAPQDTPDSPEISPIPNPTDVASLETPQVTSILESICPDVTSPSIEDPLPVIPFSTVALNLINEHEESETLPGPPPLPETCRPNAATSSEVSTKPKSPQHTQALTTVSRSIEPESESTSHTTIWCLDHVRMRSCQILTSWSNESSASIPSCQVVHIPEIQGVSYENMQPQDRWDHGWTCSKCDKLVGDLVIFSVSDENPETTCEDCLLKDYCLRSKTFVLFIWSNREQVGRVQSTPKLDAIRPECSICHIPLSDGADWLHCISCRHFKSRDICSHCYSRELQAPSPCTVIRCVVPISTPPSVAEPAASVTTTQPIHHNNSRPFLEREWSASSFDSLSPPPTTSPITPYDLPWKMPTKSTTMFPQFTPPSAYSSSASPWLNGDHLSHSVSPWTSQEPNSYQPVTYTNTSHVMTSGSFQDFPVPGQPLGYPSARSEFMPMPRPIRPGVLHRSSHLNLAPPRHPSRANFKGATLPRLMM